MSHQPQTDCYSHLDSKSRTIRLLILPPALPDQDQRIDCQIKTVPLDEHPIYQALSYTWGESDDLGHQIWVNGHPLNVRVNLWHALKAIISRDRTEEETAIWVDALCINQSDVKERNHQVGLMREIYKGAVQVLVWLGCPEIPPRNDAYGDQCEWPLDQPSLAFELLKTSKPVGLELYKPRLSVQKFVKRDTLEDHWRQAAALVSLPYWDRVWIIQEICLARKIVILYGNMECEWDDDLRTTCDVGEHYIQYCTHWDLRTYFALKQLLSTTARKLVTQRLVKSASYHVSLWEIVEISETSLSHDRKDKIYAVFGLAREVESIEIDYEKSLFALYGDVIKSQTNINHPWDTIQPLSQDLQRSLLNPDVNGYGGFEIPRRECNASDHCISLSGIILKDVSPLLYEPSWLELKRGDVKSAFQEDVLPKNFRGWSDALRLLWSADHDNIASSKEAFSCCRVYGKPDISTQFKPPAIPPHSAEIQEVLHTNTIERKHPSIFIVNLPEQPATQSIIGIGPTGMESTDLVCYFSETSMALVLRTRYNYGHLEIFGIALLAPKVPKNSVLDEGLNGHGPWSPLPNCYIPEFDEYVNKIRLDIVGLQCLSSPLRWRKT